MKSGGGGAGDTWGRLQGYTAEGGATNLFVHFSSIGYICFLISITQILFVTLSSDPVGRSPYTADPVHIGALDGGSPCRLSILRKAHVTCHLIPHVPCLLQKDSMSHVDFKK